MAQDASRHLKVRTVPTVPPVLGVWCLVPVLVLVPVLAPVLTLRAITYAQAPVLTGVVESDFGSGRQIKGLVALAVGDTTVDKRFVIRMPGQTRRWNGSLVIGAHGGGGGNNFDRSGNVIGTDETALDDVIGHRAMVAGFAYASFDRDGGGNGLDGLRLTYQFTDIAKAEVERRGGRGTARVYLVGLSAGGGITRLAAEDAAAKYAGTLIIAGAGGDLVTRLDKQTRMAALWPLIDPQAHFGIPDNDPKILAYAEAIGTPVEARRLWPYTGAGAVAAAARPQTAVETITGRLRVPTIEVAGTWDDLVIRELRVYEQRAAPPARHRLYQVEGVWHMSSDDDGVLSFQYLATSRMKLDPDVANAMREGPSYLPTVREAFDHLVRWVEHGTPPPASQIVKPGAPLRLDIIKR